MKPTRESVIADALRLTEEDRAAVLAAIEASLADVPFDDPEIEAEWAEEIKQRLEDIDAGKVEMIPWEEVRDEIP